MRRLVDGWVEGIVGGVICATLCGVSVSTSHAKDDYRLKSGDIQDIASCFEAIHGKAPRGMANGGERFGGHRGMNMIMVSASMNMYEYEGPLGKVKKLTQTPGYLVMTGGESKSSPINIRFVKRPSPRAEWDDKCRMFHIPKPGKPGERHGVLLSLKENELSPSALVFESHDDVIGGRSNRLGVPAHQNELNKACKTSSELGVYSDAHLGHHSGSPWDQLNHHAIGQIGGPGTKQAKTFRDYVLLNAAARIEQGEREVGRKALSACDSTRKLIDRLGLLDSPHKRGSTTPAAGAR